MSLGHGPGVRAWGQALRVVVRAMAIVIASGIGLFWLCVAVAFGPLGDLSRASAEMFGSAFTRCPALPASGPIQLALATGGALLTLNACVAIARGGGMRPGRRFLGVMILFIAWFSALALGDCFLAGNDQNG